MLVAGLLAPTTAPTTVRYHVINIFPGGSINAAVELAKPGDVIMVQDGEYHESIEINRSGTNTLPIFIKAQNPGAAIIDGGGISGRGSFINIEGLTVRNVRNDLQSDHAAVR